MRKKSPYSGKLPAITDSLASPRPSPRGKPSSNSGSTAVGGSMAALFDQGAFHSPVPTFAHTYPSTASSSVRVVDSQYGASRGMNGRSPVIPEKLAEFHRRARGIHSSSLRGVLAAAWAKRSDLQTELGMAAETAQVSLVRATEEHEEECARLRALTAEEREATAQANRLLVKMLMDRHQEEAAASAKEFEAVVQEHQLSSQRLIQRHRDDCERMSAQNAQALDAASAALKSEADLAEKQKEEYVEFRDTTLSQLDTAKRLSQMQADELAGIQRDNAQKEEEVKKLVEQYEADLRRQADEDQQRCTVLRATASEELSSAEESARMQIERLVSEHRKVEHLMKERSDEEGAELEAKSKQAQTSLRIELDDANHSLHMARQESQEAQSSNQEWFHEQVESVRARERQRAQEELEKVRHELHAELQGERHRSLEVRNELQGERHRSLEVHNELATDIQSSADEECILMRMELAEERERLQKEMSQMVLERQSLIAEISKSQGSEVPIDAGLLNAQLRIELAQERETAEEERKADAAQASLREADLKQKLQEQERLNALAVAQAQKAAGQAQMQEEYLERERSKSKDVVSQSQRYAQTPQEQLQEELSQMQTELAESRALLRAEESRRDAEALLENSKIEKQWEPEAEAVGSIPTPSASSSKKASTAVPPAPKEVAGCLFWKIELSKTDDIEDFGFSHASAFVRKLNGPEALLIKGVHVGGPLDRWNQAHAAHPNVCVQCGDRIVGVNGKVTIDEMQRDLSSRKVETAAIRIARYPPRFEVEFSKKGGQKLGFRFERPHNASLEELRITELLSSGCAVDYNTQQIAAGLWHLVVMSEMRIESVNGFVGDAMELAEELRQCHTAKLVLRRGEAARAAGEKVQKGLRLLKASHAMKGVVGTASGASASDDYGPRVTLS